MYSHYLNIQKRDNNLIRKFFNFNYCFGKYVKICWMCFDKPNLKIEFDISLRNESKKFVFLEEDII